MKTFSFRTMLRFTKIFIFELHKHIIEVFCYLFKVPEIQANLMVVMLKFDIHKFHFCCLHTTKILQLMLNRLEI